MISIEQARTFYEGADSAHDFDHILRVLAMADKIARAEGADVEVVRAAALLHDIARADEDRGAPIDHAEASARRAQALLLEQGESREFANRVAAAIRAHRFRGDAQPDSLEGQVLFDADKLDSIGAIGVARAYSIAGSLNQRLYAEADGNSTATRDQHNSEHTPVAEYRIKLSKLRERFHTPTARGIADARHAFMQEYFQRLAAEVHGEC